MLFHASIWCFDYFRGNYWDISQQTEQNFSNHSEFSSENVLPSYPSYLSITEKKNILYEPSVWHVILYIIIYYVVRIPLLQCPESVIIIFTTAHVVHTPENVYT